MTIGLTLLTSPAALAAPQKNAEAETPVRIAAVVSHDGEESIQDVQSFELAENCYLEVQKHRTPQGRVVSRIVHECD